MVFGPVELRLATLTTRRLVESILLAAKHQVAAKYLKCLPMEDIRLIVSQISARKRFERQSCVVHLIVARWNPLVQQIRRLAALDDACLQAVEAAV